MQSNSDRTSVKQLPRRLGTWTGAAVVVGVIIGSGIFRVPSPIAAETGSLSGVALVWIIGGIVALFGALSIAELAAMYPHAGGPYVYLREAYGRPTAFLFGWMSLLTTPFSWAAQALVFAEYLGKIIAFGPSAIHVVAAALIALISAAHYRSVRMGAAVQNVSTGAKVLALLLLAVVLFSFTPHPAATLHTAIIGSTNWQGAGIALVAVLWAYDGWENLTLLSGEMKDPQRSLPRALIGGTLAVLVIYLVINAAFLMTLPFGALMASKSVAADAISAVGGQSGAAVIAALVMVSTFGSLNGSILSDPRVFYAMAEDGLFFRSVGKIHSRFETPYIAITFTAILAIIYVLQKNFLQLASDYVLGVWPFLALAVIGLFVLRRKRPDLHRPYRVLGFPFVPALFVLCTLLVILYALYTDPINTGGSLVVTLLGLPLYYIWLYWSRRRHD